MCSDLDYGSIIGTVIHTTSVPASLQAELIEHDEYIEITKCPDQYVISHLKSFTSECNFHLNFMLPSSLEPIMLFRFFSVYQVIFNKVSYPNEHV